MKALILSVVSFVILSVVFVTNKRHVHLETINENQFCMYMDSYKGKKVEGKLEVGLLGCFDGNPYDVNEANEELTERMVIELPVMYVSVNE